MKLTDKMLRMYSEEDLPYDAPRAEACRQLLAARTALRKILLRKEISWDDVEDIARAALKQPQEPKP